jgi:repressor LexA
MTTLTPRQRRILAYIRGCDIPPTRREIGDACGISSTSVVAYNLDVLEAAGYITITPGVARGIRLTGPDPRAAEIARLRAENEQLRERVAELEAKLQDRDWDIIKRVSEAIK